MRAQTQRVHVLTLEVNVHFDQVIGEDVAGFEEFIIVFQSVQNFFQATGNSRDADSVMRN